MTIMIQQSKAVLYHSLSSACMGALYGSLRQTKFSIKQGALFFGITALALNILLSLSRNLSLFHTNKKGFFSFCVVTACGSMAFLMNREGLVVGKYKTALIAGLFFMTYLVVEAVRLKDRLQNIDDLMKI